MSYNKKVSKAEKTGNFDNLGPAPQTSHDRNKVGCPHCGRNFGAQAAERHIRICANVVSKPGGIQPSNSRYRRKF